MARVRGWGVPDWLRSVPEPTLGGRMVLTFLIVACCFAVLLRNNQVLFVTSAITATVLLSALLTYLSIGRLSIDRSLPRRVFAGALFDVRLRVRNGSRWRPALGIGFLDALQVADAQALLRGPVLPVLPPGASVLVSYPRRIHRRGVYTVVNTLARTRFPFGIFERRVLTQSPARLVVLPALGRLGRATERELARRAAAPRERRRARAGAEEFEGLREYRPGDNPRHIHWRTSARARTLVRRVLRDEESGDLHVFLDLWAGGGDAERRRRNLERAISCAATLLAHATARGRRATVHFEGGTAGHAGTRAGLLGALEALAGLPAAGAAVDGVVAATPLPRGAVAILLSLAGPAEACRRAAAAKGIALRVWDLEDPAFPRLFSKR
ncbi:MAG TPA: DUF58 domain-containing protein [Planctomycetota bacterium]|nr:DUF58 domain-containing protein [Planctomycetota bacterium]